MIIQRVTMPQRKSGAYLLRSPDYFFFLQRLRKYLIPALDVVVYCVMPTHYHLVVRVNHTSEVSRGVSKAMMRFSVSYTKAMNKRYDRVGALFQGAFRAKHVNQNNYLVHLSRYIHLNPVMEGLVERAEDWEFSSYQEYIGVRDGTLPTPEIVLSQFPSRGAYRQFVESYTGDEEEVIADLLYDRPRRSARPPRSQEKRDGATATA